MVFKNHETSSWETSPKLVANFFQARLKSAPDVFVGAIVCKLDVHRVARRGYIAMLAVHSDYRRLKIGRTLVRYAIDSMIAQGCDEVFNIALSNWSHSTAY